MRLIENITNDANQTFNIALADGSIAYISLFYRPTIQRWSLSINHPRLTVNNMNVCSYPNMIMAYKNTAMFGIAVVTIDGLDPFMIDDFSAGRAVMFLVDQSELAEVNSFIAI